MSCRSSVSYFNSFYERYSKSILFKGICVELSKAKTTNLSLPLFTTTHISRVAHYCCCIFSSSRPILCQYNRTNVTLHVHICFGRNRIIPLMRRPNTDSTPKKFITLPRNQLLVRYAVTSPVHAVTIRCYDTR